MCERCCKSGCPWQFPGMVAKTWHACCCRPFAPARGTCHALPPPRQPALPGAPSPTHPAPRVVAHVSAITLKGVAPPSGQVSTTPDHAQGSKARLAPLPSSPLGGCRGAAAALVARGAAPAVAAAGDVMRCRAVRGRGMPRGALSAAAAAAPRAQRRSENAQRRLHVPGVMPAGSDGPFQQTLRAEKTVLAGMRGVLHPNPSERAACKHAGASPCRSWPGVWTRQRAAPQPPRD
jgi:hypothetical protein